MTVFTMSAGDWATSHDSVHDVCLCPSSVVVSPLFFHLILQSLRMFHLCPFRVLVPVVFPAALSALLFHVPMMILSLPRIFDDAPVACLTPPSCCTAEGAVLVDPSGDPSGIIWFLFVTSWSVSFVVEPFRRLALVFEL